LPRHTTIALTPVHADRARHIARHLGIPTGAFLATQIDLAFENEFGIRPSTVTQVGNDLQIELRDDLVCIPTSQAASVARALRDLASGVDRHAAMMNMDVPATLTISRYGRGLIIETAEAPAVRQSMGFAEAKRLADELDRHA
jgi:hypothetical protein